MHGTYKPMKLLLLSNACMYMNKHVHFSYIHILFTQLAHKYTSIYMRAFRGFHQVDKNPSNTRIVVGYLHSTPYTVIQMDLYAREAWFHICQALGRPLPPTAHSVIAWWKRLRWSWHGHQRKGIDTLFALVSWRIWKERETTSTVTDLLPIIKAKADQWAQAGAVNLRSLTSGG
jgi:hypothetical protein